MTQNIKKTKYSQPKYVFPISQLVERLKSENQTLKQRIQQLQTIECMFIKQSQSKVSFASPNDPIQQVFSKKIQNLSQNHRKSCRQSPIRIPFKNIANYSQRNSMQAHEQKNNDKQKRQVNVFKPKCRGLQIYDDSQTDLSRIDSKQSIKKISSTQQTENKKGKKGLEKQKMMINLKQQPSLNIRLSQQTRRTLNNKIYMEEEK